MKKTGYFCPPSEKEKVLVSSPSAISQKKSGGVSTVTYQDGLFCAKGHALRVIMPCLSKNGTVTDFSSPASGNPCMYRIAVFAKTLDFTVSQICQFYYLGCAVFKNRTEFRPIRRRCPPDIGRQRRLFFCSFFAYRFVSVSRYGSHRFPAASAVALSNVRR